MRLLLTRPEAQAEAFAEELRALGHEAIVQPLLEYRRLPFDASALRQADALIVTSANALRALTESDALGSALGLTFYCAGAETARAAQRLGAKTIGAVTESAAELAEAILSSVRPNCRFLHVAGEHQAFDIAGALARAALSCRTLTVYTMTACSRFQPEVERRLAGGEVEGVILMSPRTAEVFTALCEAARLTEQARRAAYFCLSERVAEKLKCMSPIAVHVTGRADRQSLLRLIGSAGISKDTCAGRAVNPM